VVTKWSFGLTPLLGQHDPGRHAEHPAERGAETQQIEPAVRLQYQQSDPRHSGDPGQ
jgi:hypothetical protein